MEDKIIEIIAKVCGSEIIKENREIDLIETGLLDSLGFMELIALLEEEFNIEFELTKIKSDTWRKVDNIIDLVNKYLEGDE